MGETNIHQYMNASTPAEQKLAYMQALKESIQQVDTNGDGRITTQEQAADDLRKYIEQRQATHGKEADPLKDLRADIAAGGHGAEMKTLLGIANAQRAEVIKDALNTAASLTGPSHTNVHIAAAGAAAPTADAQTPEGSRQALNSQLGPLANTPAMKNGLDKVYANPSPGGDVMMQAKEKLVADTLASMPEAVRNNPDVVKAMREGYGLPATAPAAHGAQPQKQEPAVSQQQQAIAALGAELAKYNPQHVEATPNAQQLAAAVNAASQTKGNAR